MIARSSPARRWSPLGVTSAVVGVGLFVLTLRQTGLGPIAEGISRVGAGFLVIVALAGARLWLRGKAWTLCTDDEACLPTADAFRAMVAGDALGNLTPLGLLASEPAKAAFVRDRVTLMSALSGIALENLIYTLSVAAVIATGTIALLFTFNVPAALQWVSIAALGGVVLVATAGAAVMLRGWKIVSSLVAWLDRRSLAPAGLRTRLEKLRDLEDRVCGFASRHPGRLPRVLALDAVFHVLAVAEVWVVLALLTGTWPGLLSTFVLEAVNRTITVVFKFVPLRIGVDEAGTELLTRTLALPAGLGVTMAIIRKARVLTWAAVGVAFLAQRGLRREDLQATAR
jgi:hypothetical protein